MESEGRYQLVRKLAMGGMAEVFLAKAFGPKGFEKTLVLKRILPHLAQQPSFVEMFLSEAMLAARLTHPHIVQIFDFGEADGAYYLAMEYIDGPNLRALIKSASRQGVFLPAPLCARLVSQACEGLAFAHDFADPDTGESLGLVHRDISPDNLLLSRQGSVKVVDFGIAKAMGQGHKTESGVVRGKLSYMPPEQLRAQRLDRRADVYALGIVLYELLTGHKPYTSSTDVGLMQTVLFEPPVPATRYRPDLPKALQRILERATAKEREQRYPDCHAFQSDLEEFILSLGKPVTAQQIAQLIQKTTAGNGLPAQQPPPPAELPSMAAPLLTGSFSRLSGAVTERDTVPNTSRAPRTISLSRRGAGEPSRNLALPGGSLKARLANWGRSALASGVFMLVFMLLGGLVVWKMGVIPERPVAMTGSVAPSMANGPSSLPPSTPAQPKESPANLGDVGGSGQIGPSEQPNDKSPAEKPRAEKPRSRATPSKKPQGSAKPEAVPPPPAPSPAKAFLDLDAKPYYADVKVDGVKVKDSMPLNNPLMLLAGDHVVEFTEAGAKNPRILKQTVTLHPGQKVMMIANFKLGSIRFEEE